MVSFKKLLIATSLILSEVAASPFPANKLSVAAAETRAINDFSAQSRSLNDDSSAHIEISDEDKRAVAPPKTPALRPGTTSPDAPVAPPGVRPDGPEARPNSPPPRLGQEERPATCRRFAPRSEALLRRGQLERSTNPSSIDENQFVMASSVGQGEASVTNLSGCTALFFYDARMRPSVFHVFCGEEYERSKQAANMVHKGGLDENGVKVMAADQGRYNEAVRGIKEVAPDITVHQTNLYDDSPTKGGSTLRKQITTKAGTLDLTEQTVQGCSRQPQKF